MKQALAIGMLMAGIGQWYWPNWNGLFFEPSIGVTVGEGRIIAAILGVGAAILWFMPQTPEPKP